MKTKACVIAALLVSLMSATAHAQYPDRPVRIVVGFAAGGAPDLTARIVAQKLTVSLKQPVFVENRTGSGGNISLEQVANAAPDGHTLLLGADSQFAINPHLYDKMIDPLNTLAPVATVVSNQFFLAVNPNLPVSNFAEFIEYARKAKPALAYGSAGNGSQGHLNMELLKKRAGIDLLHVPYRGGGQAIVAAIGGGGEVPVILSGSATSPQIEAGKIRGLAVTSRERVPAFPNLPAVAEFYPGYEVTVWLGLFTTAGTPEPVVARLRDAVAEALSDPDTVSRIAALHMRPYQTSRAELQALIRRDYDNYKEIVRELGVKLN